MAHSDLVARRGVVLSAERASLSYGDRVGVAEVSLDVHHGRVTCLVGRNGSGKTSLLRLLGGILRPTRGNVVLDGTELRTLSRNEIARRVAIVFQDRPVPFDLTVEEIVAMGRAPHQRRLQWDTSQDRKVVSEALRRLCIEHLRNRAFNEISSGERQRVALARALAQQPRVLLLDEPTAHLDIAAAVSLGRTIRRLAGEGLAIVAAVHDLTFAANLADSVVVLAHGRCVASGSPREALTPSTLQGAFGASFVDSTHNGMRIIVATDASHEEESEEYGS